MEGTKRAEALAGQAAAHRRRAEPTAVLNQVQGCGGEERRKFSRISSPSVDGIPEPVWPSGGCKKATELATLGAFPEPALTQDRAGQQGADSKPHLPGSVSRSREHRPVGFCAASPRPVPLYVRPSGPSRIFDLLCLRSPLAQSPLIPPPSFLPLADHLIS